MTTMTSTQTQELKQRRRAPVETPTDLSAEATRDIAGAMNAILADVFALYLKTKNFHSAVGEDHLPRDEVVPDTEMFQGPLGLRSPELLGRHIHRSETLVSNARDSHDRLQPRASFASHSMPTRHFATTGLEKEPSASFRFIDPRLNQAGGGQITVLVADIVRLT